MWIIEIGFDTIPALSIVVAAIIATAIANEKKPEVVLGMAIIGFLGLCMGTGIFLSIIMLGSLVYCIIKACEAKKIFNIWSVPKLWEKGWTYLTTDESKLLAPGITWYAQNFFNPFERYYYNNDEAKIYIESGIFFKKRSDCSIALIVGSVLEMDYLFVCTLEYPIMLGAGADGMGKLVIKNIRLSKARELRRIIG